MRALLMYLFQHRTTEPLFGEGLILDVLPAAPEHPGYLCAF